MSRGNETDGWAKIYKGYQASGLSQYAIQNGFKVVREFTDIETAKKTGRTEFTKMLTYLEESPDTRTILELSNRAHILYETQPAAEKQKLFKFLLSNSKMEGKTVHFELKKGWIERLIGWGGRNRTLVHSSRNCCPAVRRLPIRCERNGIIGQLGLGEKRGVL